MHFTWSWWLFVGSANFDHCSIVPLPLIKCTVVGGGGNGLRWRALPFISITFDWMPIVSNCSPRLPRNLYVWNKIIVKKNCYLESKFLLKKKCLIAIFVNRSRWLRSPYDIRIACHVHEWSGQQQAFKTSQFHELNFFWIVFDFGSLSKLEQKWSINCKLKRQLTCCPQYEQCTVLIAW